MTVIGVSSWNELIWANKSEQISLHLYAGSQPNIIPSRHNSNTGHDAIRTFVKP